MGSGEVVNVVINLQILDLDDLCTSETLPVKIDLVVEAGEILADQAYKIDGVWCDIGVILAVFEETDDRGGQQVLESGIAAGRPHCAVYQGAFE